MNKWKEEDQEKKWRGLRQGREVDNPFFFLSLSPFLFFSFLFFSFLFFSFLFIKYWPWRRLALLVEILANKFLPSAVVPALPSIWFFKTWEWRMVRAFLEQDIHLTNKKIEQKKSLQEIWWMININCTKNCFITKIWKDHEIINSVRQSISQRL